MQEIRSAFHREVQGHMSWSTPWMWRFLLQCTVRDAPHPSSPAPDSFDWPSGKIISMNHIFLGWTWSAMPNCIAFVMLCIGSGKILPKKCASEIVEKSTFWSICSSQRLIFTYCLVPELQRLCNLAFLHGEIFSLLKQRTWLRFLLFCFFCCS